MGPVEEEEEFPETFELTAPPTRIVIDELPQSPKSLAVRMIESGWDVRPWLTVGESPAVFYASNSDEKNKKSYRVGDVRSEGYTARWYCIEAREDVSKAIGFRAFYMGKKYESGKKGTGGTFIRALVVDPIGFPTSTEVNYKLIEPSRVKFETEKSYAIRLGNVQSQVADMKDHYNDGERYWPRARWFTQVGELDAWIDGWKGLLNA